MSNYTFGLSDIGKLNVYDSLRDNIIRNRNVQFVRVFYVIDKLTIYVKHSFKASKHVEIYKVIRAYVIASVLAVCTRGLYKLSYYKDNVLTIYYIRTKII